MVEPRQRLGLALEAREPGRRKAAEAAVEDLDRDVPPEPDVLGEEHRALPAAPELLEQPVVAEDVARRPRRRRAGGAAASTRVERRNSRATCSSWPGKPPQVLGARDRRLPAARSSS